ncbi:translocation/assembly module TamB domain-containing protein [Amaricoccus sp.]|uniref:translocation/assembly module TamB domain-containing protein n=1 Tax=Amaricoccus sp. TaxID=1872485 RepID=UPI001B7766F1|nr:translocation/assembly module TamB domain-containing protein [Amaricoccus sp.]MBP7242710.1 translocation/assembly module TamB domain-containing protein [Amaricoccus sp.]
MKRLLAIFGVIALVAVAAVGQDLSSSEQDDNGFIINFIQSRISAPGREIGLHGVSGALSSQARIASLTVSDDEGVWLTLTGVEIDWTRLALLRRRLDINRLAVERIEFARRPVPHETGIAERLPVQAEAQPFRLPELPLSVRIADLDLPRIDLGPAAVGQAARLAANGSADLARGALDAGLNVRRIDGPGGELALDLDFANATGVLDLDLQLSEPQGGVVATLAGIEGAPAIDVRLQGGGPLDDLDLAFGFDADAARIATGDIRLRATPEGRGFTVDFRGGLAPVVPAPYRPFFAGETSVEVAGVALAAGGMRLDRFAVKGAELDLTGTLATAADGFPRDLTLAGRLGDPNAPAVVLPVSGGATSIHSAVLDLAYGQGRRWTGRVVLDRLRAGEVAVEDVTLTLGGLAENLDDPARRNLTFAVEGEATGVSSENPDIAAVLGDRLDIFADAALPPGGPLHLRQVQATGKDVSLFAAGDVRGTAFTGRIGARLSDLAPASGLAGRELGGGLDLRLDGSLDPLARSFDVAVAGTAQDLRLGDPRLDGLLQGETTLGGRVARDPGGFRPDGLRIANANPQIASTGKLTSDVTDFAIDGRLADLSVLDRRLEGALTATGRASGKRRPLTVAFEAQIPEGRVLDRDLAGARIGFDGQVNGADVSGVVSGAGALGDQPISVAASLDLAAGARALRDLDVRVGPNAITGELSQQPEQAILGVLNIAAPDLEPLAALALVEAQGSAEATLRFEAAETGQGVAAKANLRDVASGGMRLGGLDLDAYVEDALATPLLRGSLDATGLVAGGVDVETLSARASQTGPRAMRVDADARLAIGTVAQLAGTLDQRPDGFVATLETLSLQQRDVVARLTAPATVTVAGPAITLTPLALDLGDGRLTAQGTVGETLDVSVDLTRLPLSLANLVQPALGLEGHVDGALRATGARDAPNVSFDVTGEGVAAAASHAAGLPPARIVATGRTADDRLTLDARVEAQGLAAHTSGSVPLGQGNLDLAVDLTSLPLQLLDRAAGNRGLGGTVSGTARIAGTTAQPDVSFDLRGAGITAQPLRDAGVTPLAIDASGGFLRDVLTLSEASARNDQGLALRASGRAPLRGPGLDLRASGEAPLALADALLANRAAQARGLVRFDLTARGALARPLLSGTASLAGGTFTDPQSNLRLQDISADVGFDGQTATVRSFRAASAMGGTIAASGTISLAAGNPANLEVTFAGVRYTDGQFVSTTVDGQLRAEGPLRGGGTVSGRIDLGPTEISVAEGLGANVTRTVEVVQHVQPSPGVTETLRRARLDEPRTPASSQLPLNADIRIRAPNRIFVRGRGLDVELGGEMRITGPLNDLVPVGQFELRRGRLDILGQRIEFTRGTLQLTGSFNPIIDFRAQTRARGVTAIVQVTGRVSQPEIHFSSEPPLPEDEVLARVIFNQSVSQLSPFQIAELAAAAAELAGGGGGPGILEQLRGAIGFDDLDIVTEEDGSTALRAGTYIDDNIYLDVQSDTSGDTRAQINLDLSDNLTVRGSVASDGNSTIGVFFERDY